jgi:hypothetical protein
MVPPITPPSLASSSTHSRVGIAGVLACAVLLLVPLLLLAPAIGPGRTVFGVDFAHVAYHVHGWVTAQLAAGRLPVWDPHQLCGFPLLAGVQVATFYPPTWLHLVLSDAVFWTGITWLHLALAGVFTDAWLRRGLGVARGGALVGALLFAMSGYVITHLFAGHVNYVWAYPWGPFALWRLERWLAAPTLRRAVLLALPLPFMVLAGLPQLAFASGLVLVARCADFALRGDDAFARRMRVLAGAALAIGVGMLLTAPQVLPTIELIGQTQRVAVNASDFVNSYALPRENLLTFLAPALFGDGASRPYWGLWLPWEICGYVGIVGLLLAGLGAASRHRQARFWLGAGVLALLIALGPFTPVFAIFHALVPGASFFRAPGRYLYVFVLAAAALASFGAQVLLEADARGRQLARRAASAALLVAALLLATALVGWALGSDSSAWRAIVEHADRARAASRTLGGGAALPTADPAFRASSLDGAHRALLAAAGWAAASGGVLLAWALDRLRGRVALAVLAILLIADLAAFDRRYVRAIELADLEFAPQTAALLARRNDPAFRLTSTVVADAGRAHAAGLAHSGGYDAMLLGRYADLLNTLEDQPLEQPVVVATVGHPHPIAALMGVKQWLVPSGSLADPDLKLVRTLADGRDLLESRAALPRLFMAQRSVVRPDVRERLAILRDPAWDPRAVVVLEDAALHEEDFGSDATRDAVIDVRTYGTGEYRADVDAPRGGFLVLAEAWFPGWRVEVDGREAPLLRADHLFQGVRLEPGRHQVRFVYRSRLVTLGLLLAAGAMLVPCAIALVQRRRAAYAG